jgi:hypothetical protein
MHAKVSLYYIRSVHKIVATSLLLPESKTATYILNRIVEEPCYFTKLHSSKEEVRG